MKSRAAIAGHPLHPIFVCIPIGLWCFAPVCDLVYHLGWGDNSWKLAALYCLAGGLIAAVPAIITGWIDYGIIEEPRAARVARFHLILNLCALPIFIVSVWLRLGEIPPNYSLLPVFISLVGVTIIGLSGWLGGELVSRHRISVHEPGEK
jgi:uncharacterized membrane protein